MLVTIGFSASDSGHESGGSALWVRTSQGARRRLGRSAERYSTGGGRMRHWGRRSAAAVTAATLVIAQLVVNAQTAQAADPVNINLLTINDFHGRIDANTVKFAGTVEGLKQADGAGGANTLIVGAGDFIGASLFASAVAQDQPTIDVFNELGLDVSAVG